MLQQELGVENQKGDLGEYKRSKLIDLGDWVGSSWPTQNAEK
jgi:hypothetical protein